MKTRLIAAPLLAAALVTGACARSSQTRGGGGIEHPTGPNDLILRVDTAGGFVAPTFLLKQIPQFSLFGDGRLITEGPQIQIYPGPALPSVLTQTITEDGIQKLLEAARQAGLLGPDASYRGSCISDQPTTTFTLFVNGERHVISVYALGANPSGCSGSDADAIAKLAAFQAKLGDLMSWLPEGSVGPQSPYTPTEIRVHAQPYSGAPDPNLSEPPMNWPLSQPLASFGQPDPDVPNMRCGVVSGNDTPLLLAEAQNANELTPWRSGGSQYSLIFRPLLPDEHTC